MAKKKEHEFNLAEFDELLAKFPDGTQLWSSTEDRGMYISDIKALRELLQEKQDEIDYFAMVEAGADY